MKNEGVRLGQFQAGRIDAEDAGVFAGRREQPFLLALPLDAQDVDHIGAFQGFFHAVMNGNREVFHIVGDKGRGTGHVHIGPHLGETPDIGARHAAVEDIADNGHFETFDGWLMFQDGIHIQQGLSGMLMGAVPAVDYDGLQNLGRIVAGSFGLVAHDNGIDAHGFHRQQGVAQAFTLDDTAGAGSDVDYVASQVFAGQFERRAGTGAGFKKQIDNGFAAQGRQFLDVPADDVLHFFGRIEDQFHFGYGHGLQFQDVFAPQGRGAFHHIPPCILIRAYGLIGRKRALKNAFPPPVCRQEGMFTASCVSLAGLTGPN